MTSLNDEHNRKPLEVIPFSVSARTAMQLGRESISSSVVAILELVKNAYDADAENVTIYFGNDPVTGKPILIIDDDGKGMSYEQLKNKWMVIGINDKVLNRKSEEKGRIRIGEKGLGRLGLDKLCETTHIQTFSKSATQGFELVIDWRKYENNNGKLEDVTHEVYSFDDKVVFDLIHNDYTVKSHGTRLILLGLKDDWFNGYKGNSREDKSILGKLRSELSLLVSPFNSINDFSISIRFQDQSIKIEADEILEIAEWTVKSNLTTRLENNNYVWYIHHDLYSGDSLKSSYDEPWNKTFPEFDRQEPECGPLDFIMYFIPRQTVEDLDFSLSQIKEFMDANQGIRIYRDQFRVKPYGDPSGQHDWLNLALNRVRHPTSRGQNGWRLAYNQAVGALFIERDTNVKLLDQTNREGLVEGNAFDDMRLFTRHAIEWFEHEDTKYQKRAQPIERIRKATEGADESTGAAEDAVIRFGSHLDQVLSSIEKRTSSKTPADLRDLREELTRNYNDLVITSVERFKDAQDEMRKAFEEKTSALEAEKDTLANLASLGILMVSFGHETKYYTNLVVTNAGLLQKNIRRVLASNASPLAQRIEHELEDLLYGAERINTFAEFTLKGVRRDKRKRVQVYVDQLISRVFKDFGDLLTEKLNIEIELDLPDKLDPMRAFYIDFESILINFITNAVWALDTVPKGKKKIRVKVYRQENNIHILFADSGCGIAPDAIHRIFEPTFTTKRNKDGEKWGTGMGLAIVDNLIKSYGGKINALSPSDLGGAEFHIQLPAFNLKQKV